MVDSSFSIPRKRGHPRKLANGGRKNKELAVVIAGDSGTPNMLEVTRVKDNLLILPESQDYEGVLTRARRAFLVGKCVGIFFIIHTR